MDFCLLTTGDTAEHGGLDGFMLKHLESMAMRATRDRIGHFSEISLWV